MGHARLRHNKDVPPRGGKRVLRQSKTDAIQARRLFYASGMVEVSRFHHAFQWVVHLLGERPP